MMFDTVHIEFIKELNKATLENFLEIGKYTMTKRQAFSQFGKTSIELLITNGLLQDRKTLPGTKSRFLLSDIITAMKLYEEMDIKR